MPPDSSAQTPPALLLLSAVDVQLIQTIAKYKYMSAKDIAYFHYEPTSLTYVRRRASRLAGGADHVNSYLYRFSRPHTEPGRSEKIYAVGIKGWELIASLHGSAAVDERTKPYKLQALSYPFIFHALLLSRFIAAGTFWSRQQTNYTLVDARPCYELGKNRALTSITVQGKAVSVIGDAFLCFERIADGMRFPLLFEADCGTETGRHLRHHVRNRLAYIQSPQYEEFAKTRAARVCYLTTGLFPRYKESRRVAMQRWALEVLTELGLDHWASVFLFASVDYETMYDQPHRLFTEPVWYKPDEPDPVPLFDQ
jgi:hypothetical protein